MGGMPEKPIDGHAGPEGEGQGTIIVTASASDAHEPAPESGAKARRPRPAPGGKGDSEPGSAPASAFMRLSAIVFVLVALSLFMVARPARANCSCGVLSSLIRSASERIVTGVGALVNVSVKEAATYSTQNVHKDLVALREAVLMGQETISSAIEVADREAAERDFDKTWDLGAQPITNCGNDTMGGELMLSKESLEETGKGIMDKVVERRSRHERPVDYLAELSTFPGPEKAQEALGALSSGKTMTLGELREAERLIESVTDPLPARGIPERLGNSPAGRVYVAQKAQYEARQGLYQSVMARRLADRAPTVDGLAKWAQGKWREMGGEGDVPGLVEGRLSQEALFWILANMRLASGNWHEEILPRLPEAGLLREMASMMAVELELSRKRNEHLENISLLLSLNGLGQLEAGAGEALRNQYRRAISGSQ